MGAAMADIKERRYMERFRLPQARLYYRISNKTSFFNGYRGPAKISDINKCSLGIVGSLELTYGTPLMLKIILPDYPEIILKGHISGFLKDHNGLTTRTIIQLMPYGYDVQYNSFKYKRRLESCLYQNRNP